MIVAEATPTRRLRLVWAFLPSLFILGGFGFVYVGKLRLEIATMATFYGVVAFFSWTRLIVSMPYGYWVAAGVILLIIVVTTTVAPIAGSIPINELRGRAQFLWFSKSNYGVLWSRIGTRLSPEN